MTGAATPRPWWPCSVEGCHCKSDPEMLHVETDDGTAYGPRLVMLDVLRYRRSHDALVAACRLAIDRIDPKIGKKKGFDKLEPWAQEVVDACAAALALAKEGRAS